jgi:hypothetical protein
MKKLLLTVFLTISLLLSSCQSADNEPFCSEENILISGICHDKTPPIISGLENISIYYGEEFDPLYGVTATDDFDDDVTEHIVVVEDVDITELGMYFLKYTVSDLAGNTVEEVRYITVVYNVLEDEKNIVNGDFTYGLFSWKIYTVSAGGDGIFTEVDEELVVEIVSINDGIKWEPRIHNEGIYFEQGKTYQVSFDAKSDLPRSIKMHIGELFNGAPYFQYFMGDGQTIYDLSTVYQTFTTTFIMTEDSNLNGAILFEFGDVEGSIGTTNLITTIYIDNVVIIEID